MAVPVSRAKSPWYYGAIILAGIVVILVLGVLASYSDKLKVHPPDYCPTGTWAQAWRNVRVPGETAILIDTSNAISAQDAGAAFTGIDSWARGSAPWLQRLSIHALPESASDLDPRGYGSWCVPKEGEDANLIYENAVYVEAQFRQFLAKLRDIFRELVSRQEADESPIVETMAHLVQRNEDLDSIVLVSDMLQNTEAWSHYAKDRDVTSLPAACREITDPGRLQTVFVYYIDRGLPEIQAPEWPDEWWRRCLSGVTTETLN